MINPAYSLLLVVSGLISLFIAGVVWLRRPLAGASHLAVVMMSMTLWSLAYAFSWLVPDERGKFFWVGIAFLGVVISSPSFLAMAFEFTGRQDRINWRFYVHSYTVPLIAMIFYWTDPWFGLFFGGASISSKEDLLRGGPGLLMIGANGYVCIIWGVVHLLRYLKRAPRSKRTSVIFILIGTFFPAFGTFISILHLSPFPGLDLTPIAFTMSGIFYAYGLFTYRILNVAPVRREAILENMEDCMLVVDDLNRVLDINPHALAFVDSGVKDPTGRQLKDVFSKWQNEIRLDLGAQDGTFRVQLEGPDFHHYDISVTSLQDSKNEFAGRLIVWRDISVQKKSEIEMREMNLRLQQHIKEIQILHDQLREQAIHDSLTGLFNRRYMEEILQKEMAQALRSKSPLSVVMMDVDLFKQINDGNGHHIGDAILQGLANMLMENVRLGDTACRYGGDELVVVMPGAAEADAFARANLWREKFSSMDFVVNDVHVRTTLSLGVASMSHGFKRFEDLLIAADTALYVSKINRNTVNRFTPETEKEK